MILAADVIVLLTISDDNGILVQLISADWHKRPEIYPSSISNIAFGASGDINK